MWITTNWAAALLRWDGALDPLSSFPAIYIWQRSQQNIRDPTRLTLILRPSCSERRRTKEIIGEQSLDSHGALSRDHFVASTPHFALLCLGATPWSRGLKVVAISETLFATVDLTMRRALKAIDANATAISNGKVSEMQQLRWLAVQLTALSALGESASRLRRCRALTCCGPE